MVLRGLRRDRPHLDVFGANPLPPLRFIESTGRVIIDLAQIVAEAVFNGGNQVTREPTPVGRL